MDERLNEIVKHYQLKDITKFVDDTLSHHLHWNNSLAFDRSETKDSIEFMLTKQGRPIAAVVVELRPLFRDVPQIRFKVNHNIETIDTIERDLIIDYLSKRMIAWHNENERSGRLLEYQNSQLTSLPTTADERQTGSTQTGKTATVYWTDDPDHIALLAEPRWGKPGTKIKYAELLINVTPQAFAVMAQNFNPDVFRAYDDELLRLPKEISPDANPVNVWFADPHHPPVHPQSNTPNENFELPWWFGKIEAQTDVNGGARLFVGVTDKYLPELVELWTQLRAELERRGWILLEESVENIFRERQELIFPSGMEDATAFVKDAVGLLFFAVRSDRPRLPIIQDERPDGRILLDIATKVLLTEEQRKVMNVPDTAVNASHYVPIGQIELFRLNDNLTRIRNYVLPEYARAWENVTAAFNRIKAQTETVSTLGVAHSDLSKQIARLSSQFERDLFMRGEYDPWFGPWQSGSTGTFAGPFAAEMHAATKGQGSMKSGRPGLTHDELLYRLGKAQEAEEIRKEHPAWVWKEIAQKIEWRYGISESGLALLRDARTRLTRIVEGFIGEGDPTLDEIAKWRANETKKT